MSKKTEMSKRTVNRQPQQMGFPFCGEEKHKPWKAPSRRGSYGGIVEPDRNPPKSFDEELKDTQEDIQKVINKALKRSTIGRRLFGAYKPKVDTRNMYEEAEQELLDCINYCVFQIIKLRSLNREVE